MRDFFRVVALTRRCPKALLLGRAIHGIRIITNVYGWFEEDNDDRGWIIQNRLIAVVFAW